MSFVHGPKDVAHQSDSTCLARFAFEFDNPQPSGHFAVVGTLAHEAIELFTRESAEHPQVDPRSILRTILKQHRADPEVDDDVAHDFVEIMVPAFAKDSRLRLGLPPEPWQVWPEWKWALDDELRPISPCGNCGGTVPDEIAPPCKACASHHGWMRAPAFTGTVDRLEWDAAAGLVRARDWKSQMARESGEDVATDKQAAWYSVALLAHFDKVKEVEFSKEFLRFGYGARATFRRGDPWHEATKARMLAARARRLAAIENDRWPESLGPACNYCPRIYQCSEQHRARTSGSIPNATPTDRANDLLGVREWTKVTDADLRRHVAVTGEPIPLDDGDGTVLGKKPAKDWVLADGQTYESILEGLATIQRGRGATEEDIEAFRIAHFRFVTAAYFPSRAKKALEELMGFRQAGLLIEAGGWFEQEIGEEFSAWVPPDRVERVEMTNEQLDARLDELLGG